MPTRGSRGGRGRGSWEKREKRDKKRPRGKRRFEKHPPRTPHPLKLLIYVEVVPSVGIGISHSDALLNV